VKTPLVHVRFDEYELDSETRLLLKGGNPVPLTPKAFQLLELLVRKRPAIVSKTDILRALWPETYVSEGNVSNLVSEIRETLEDLARQPRYVRTAHGAGYAFCGTAVECGTAGPPREIHGPTICALVGESGTFPFAEGAHLVGRDEDCDLILSSPVVSRHHARISVSRDDTVIEDLKSRNGTFVGGQRLTAPVSLHDDDQVSFGNLVFYFRMLDPSKTTDTLSLHGFQGIPSSGTTRVGGPRR
jgi:DNA-binding winged helix-turn-helix (wHTH) protein